MSYENPRIPEGINVSRESAAAEFLRLLAGLAVAVSLASLVLYAAGGWLARQIPFGIERAWVGDRVIGMDARSRAPGADVAEAYLQRLTEELAASMQLPPGMQLHAVLVAEAAPNAFATLGGHILLTDGLYRRLPSENALAMVLAHEIAHVQARDPIAAAGSGAALGLLLLALGRDADTLAPHFARLVQLGYSRRAEARADDAAIAAVRNRYGHAAGAAALFEVVAAAHAGSRDVPTLLATHPADAERIARLHDAARGWDPQRQPLVPLPPLAP